MTSHRQAAPTGLPIVPPRPASSTGASTPSFPSYPRYSARGSTSTTAAAASRTTGPSRIHTIHDYNVDPIDHVVDVELVPTTSSAATTTKYTMPPKPTPMRNTNIHTLHSPVVPAVAATAAAAAASQTASPAPIRNAYSESLPDVNPNAPYPVAFFSRNRSRWQSILPNARLLSLVNLILIACVIVFIIELIVGATQYDGAIVSGNPMGGPSAQTLYEMGAKWEPVIRNDGQGWRLLSAIWLHAGILHIFVNMLALVITGYTFELRQRPYWFALILLTTGVLGNMWSCVSYASTVGVGISGALYGLLGANFAYLVYNWPLVENALLEFIILVIYAVLGIGYGFLSIASNTLDNWAHLGGLSCGIVLGMAVLPAVAKRRVWVEVVWRTVGVLGTCGLFILFSLLLFLHDPNGPTNVSNL